MTNPARNFDQLCGNASRAFLQSVVVVDNEATLGNDSKNVEPKIASRARGRSAAPGIEATIPLAGTNRANSQTHPDTGLIDKHHLSLNEVARSFASKELTCGVYLPCENDPSNDEDLIAETVQAVMPTDACVLDWQLRKGEQSHTILAIRRVLEADSKSGGRLRLIIVYTAENLIRAKADLRGELVTTAEFQITDEDDVAEKSLVIQGNHFRIVFLNKPTTTLGKHNDDDDVVQWEDLAERTIAEFTVLSKGLLRTYALHSVAAIRRNMHHILAQFDPELDRAFAADRLIKPDPDDAGRLIEEVLGSELNQTIARSRDARSCLGKESLACWLAECESNDDFVDIPVGTKTFKVGADEYRQLNADVRRRILVERSHTEQMNDKTKRWLTEKFVPQNGESARHSRKLSMLATISRHRGGPPPATDDLPRLKLGSVIQLRNSARDSEGASSDTLDDFYLCVQPLCDTVRMTSDRPFLMAKLIVDPDCFQLVLGDESDNQHLRLPKRDERIFTSVKFPVPQEGDTVVAQTSSEFGLHFVDSDSQEWLWIADLREMFAVTLGEQLLVPLGRVGINSLEWLRLKGSQ